MMKKSLIFFIVSFLLIAPISFAFSGSGGGYNLSLGAFAYAAMSNLTNGYNLTLGLYDSPVGDKSGDGMTVSLRHFFSDSEIDAVDPTITLIAPGNDSTHRFSPSILFTYLVEDTNEIANCTLAIGESEYTDTSITVNEQNNFTISPGNGVHNWNISCTDDSTNKNTGISETRIFLLSYNNPGSGGSSAGCIDACTDGERVCRDGSVWVCSDSDGDGCTENDLEYCAEDETCIEGYCTEVACVEDWFCTEWSECSNELQTRRCDDWNDCGTSQLKPAEIRACTEEVGPEEEYPATITPPTEYPEPPKPKEPSKVLAAAKYAGLSLGSLIVLGIAIMGMSMMITKTSLFLKETFSTEAILIRMAEKGIAEENIIAYAFKKGFPEFEAKRIIRNLHLDKINAEIEELSKNVGIDGHFEGPAH